MNNNVLNKNKNLRSKETAQAKQEHIIIWAAESEKTLKNNNIIVSTTNIPTRQQILAGFIFDFLSKLYYTIYIKIEEEIENAKNSV